jgi:opacity protein-like surface antigen
MRKEIISSLLVASLATSLQAGGDIGGVVSIENEVAPVEVKVPVKIEPKKEVIEAPKKVEVKKSEPSKFYVVAKGAYITGDDADSGMGAGIDLGYNFTDSLAVELGGTFTKNELDGSKNEASYKDIDLSLVYTYHATDSLGVFAKAGYMMEQVKVNASNYDENEAGAVFGAGVEYKLSDAPALVLEYERSTIDSEDTARGDLISLGLKYNF